MDPRLFIRIKCIFLSVVILNDSSFWVSQNPKFKKGWDSAKCATYIFWDINPAACNRYIMIILSLRRATSEPSMVGIGGHTSPPRDLGIGKSSGPQIWTSNRPSWGMMIARRSGLQTQFKWTYGTRQLSFEVCRQTKNAISGPKKSISLKMDVTIVFSVQKMT